METLFKYFKHILTGYDNNTFSLTKLVGVSGATAMIYQFISSHSTDFQGFSIGLSALMAALAVKYYTESK